MTGVKLREGESFEDLLKRFKKVLNRDKIMDDLKRLEHYEKPSERKRRELATARRRALRRLRQLQEKLKK
ncbi:MAG: 30S ribosomal protein S21 [Candidatus Hydrothermales bacterium]